jgi:hypothetical protein
VVDNTARTFYDLLRYWIPMAWLAQTSVFFTRQVLEEVKRPDGTYLDEDLFFTMDLDLWYRIALKYPFVRHIDQVLSYFRIYDENKTGARPHATQRECCRVFRRYVNGLNPSEHRLSYIIPVREPSQGISATVTSLTQQTSLDFDIMIVNYAEGRPAAKAVHSLALDLCEAVPQITIRSVAADEPNEFAAFNTGVRRAVAPNVAFLQPGDVVAPTATHEALQLFARDVTGLVFPNVPGVVPLERLFSPQQGLNLTEFVAGDYFYPTIFARRLALLEFNGLRDVHVPTLSIKELITRIVFRGWSVVAAPQISITPARRDYTLERGQVETFRDQIARAVLAVLKDDFERDPFAAVRAAVRDPRPLFTPQS